LTNYTQNWNRDRIY